MDEFIVVCESTRVVATTRPDDDRRVIKTTPRQFVEVFRLLRDSDICGAR